MVGTARIWTRVNCPTSLGRLSRHNPCPQRPASPETIGIQAPLGVVPAGRFHQWIPERPDPVSKVITWRGVNISRLQRTGKGGR